MAEKSRESGRKEGGAENEAVAAARRHVEIRQERPPLRGLVAALPAAAAKTGAPSSSFRRASSADAPSTTAVGPMLRVWRVGAPQGIVPEDSNGKEMVSFPQNVHEYWYT